jgi:gamma-glutamyltranspeptidase/glutathione hydrolase
MTPTLLFDGDRVTGCIGGSGGPRIISNVVQVFLDIFVFGLDAAEALAQPRIHHQWMPNRLVVEPAVPADERRALAKKGHTVFVDGDSTGVQVVVVRPDGTMEAASEPRKYGAPAAPP